MSIALIDTVDSFPKVVASIYTFTSDIGESRFSTLSLTSGITIYLFLAILFGI